MATREEARRLEEARLQQELGQQFLKQMGDMFTQTRTDMAAQFMPRAETQARMDHMDEAIERVVGIVDKLGSNQANFQETVPRIYAERTEVKGEAAELRTEIEKLKTALDAFKERGYDWRYLDAQGRMRGDAANERGWRGALQERSTQQMDRAWIGLLALIGLVSPIVSIILTLALRK